MRKSRIYVDPSFAYKLKKCRLEKEEAENRKITMPELTKQVDIVFPLENLRKIKLKKKKNDKFAF